MSQTLSEVETSAATGGVREREPLSGSAIDIRGLDVSYGQVPAVKNLSLQVREGEIFGLLGPNGAGKTTTLLAVEGLVKPQAGQVFVLGHDVQREPEAVKRSLGISLQANTFFDYLKIWELVRLYAAMYQVFPDRNEVLDLLARFQLDEKAGVQAQELSGGQLQRLALVLALVNDPRIMILDEPTTGLDPQARRSVWDVIRQVRAEGRTVLLTTHYMEEAQELCHRVGIIDRGELIALDTPAGLVNSLHANSLISAAVRLPLDRVLACPGAKTATYDGDLLVVQSDSAQETVLALQALATEQGQVLVDLTIKQPDLEDVFIALTGRKIR